MLLRGGMGLSFGMYVSFLFLSVSYALSLCLALQDSMTMIQF